MGLVPDEKVEEVSEKIRKKFGDKVIVNSGAPCLIEVINPDCCKGEAVKFLSARYGIPESEIITMGDSTNDLTLIAVGYGVAVGNAREELKKAAKEITVPFEEDPVAEIIYKYCL